MKLLLLLLLHLLPMLAIGQQKLTDWVDPRIGTGDHGHVFVGAHVPQGMVNVGPTQIETGWDWCSGYHETGDSIVGFSHLHLSGTGCSDLGDIALMPSSNPLIDLSTLESLDTEALKARSRQLLASPYSHRSEEVRPGYYRVTLGRDSVVAEMTSSERVALHRYTYPGQEGVVTIDLLNAVGDNLRTSRLYRVNDHTLAGFRVSRGWAGWQQVYFRMEFSVPFEPVTNSFGNQTPQYPSISTFRFHLPQSRELLVKVALSPVGEANAALNMEAEMPDWDFVTVRAKALDRWEQELKRIDASFSTEREARIFYTAMYHFLMAPQIWSDVNGDYMGSDEVARYQPANPASDDLPVNYTTWSLWDTYRAAHPLATLVMRDKLTDYARSMLRINREQGELPVWHLMSNETYCMVGCPAVPVLADMCLKGVGGFDYHEAFKAMKQSLLKDNRSLDWMKKLGYVPYNHGDWEPVAKSLEYYLADWSAARVAAMLAESGDTHRDSIYRAEADYFNARSMGYKRLFDPVLRCMRALDSDGQFRSREGFNPCHQTSDYTEGNPWQYTWLVPHDVHGLVDCFPSEQDFVNRLDSLFLAPSELNADANPDITGLIGQYAHGNEPSHHVIYLYNYVGQPAKAARRLRQVMGDLYDDKPAGLCGNEDVGQMSAWYILSAMGLYQVEPCGGRYVLGSPIVCQASLRVDEGKTFSIRSVNNSDRNIYVQRVTLNGKPYPYGYIDYKDIIAGGELVFYMGRKPSKWATEPEYRP